MIVKRIAADTVFLIHAGVVVIVMFGWLVPSFWYFYMLVLLATLCSEIFFSYCILSQWEFALRKKIDPLLDYEYEFASYYTYRITQGRLSGSFLRSAGTLFAALSLVINVSFRLF